MTLDEIKRSRACLVDAYAATGAKLTGNANHNHCPICNDATGLSIFEHQGVWQWKCHSRCGEGGTVVDLISKTTGRPGPEVIKDLLAKYGGTTNAAALAAMKSGVAGSRPVGRRFETIEQAQVALAETITRSARAKNLTARFARGWCYRAADGVPRLWALRFDLVDSAGARKGKEFRPLHWASARDLSGGWREGMGRWGQPKPDGGDPQEWPGLCPLYRLPELLAALKAEPDVTCYVVEGEKCSDALAAKGLVVVTSICGSGSPKKTDWSPLARARRVVLVPDVDAPVGGVRAGEKYMQSVAALLS